MAIAVRAEVEGLGAVCRAPVLPCECRAYPQHPSWGMAGPPSWRSLPSSPELEAEACAMAIAACVDAEGEGAGRGSGPQLVTGLLEAEACAMAIAACVDAEGGRAAGRGPEAGGQRRGAA